MNSPEFFNILDNILFIILFLSVFVGFFRGFTKDFLGTFSWFGSAFTASFFTPYVLPQIHIHNAIIAKCVALIIVYIISLLVFKVIINTLSNSIKATFLSSIDRLMGCIFGLVRGAAILLSIPIIALLFGIQQDKYTIVKESRVATILYSLAEKLMPQFTDVTGLKIKSQKKEISSSEISRFPIEKPKKEKKPTSKKDVKQPKTDKDKDKISSSVLEQMKDYIAEMFAKRYVEQENSSTSYIPELSQTVRAQSKNDSPVVIRHTLKKRTVDKYKNVRPKYGIMNLLEAKKKRMLRLRELQKKAEIRKQLDKVDISKIN